MAHFFREAHRALLLFSMVVKIFLGIAVDSRRGSSWESRLIHDVSRTKNSFRGNRSGWLESAEHGQSTQATTSLKTT